MREFSELHHIAIIASSEKSIDFYKHLGFIEVERVDREYDVIVMMEGVCLLEIYVDPNHPARVNYPEAMGLRHVAFAVKDLEKVINDIDVEVEPIRKKENGDRFTFIKDPDGLPIELVEQGE